MKVVKSSTELRSELGGIKFSVDDFELNGGVVLNTPLGADAGGQTLKMKIATTPIPLKRFTELIPPNIITGPLGKKIKSLRSPGGTVTVEELMVTGRMGDLGGMSALAREGKLSMRLSLNSIKFTDRTLKETFSGINGLLFLDKDRLRLKDFSGNYEHGVIKELNAEITELTTEPKYDLSAHAFFETGHTIGVLQRYLNSTGGKKTKILKGTNASGMAELRLNLSGSIKELTPVDYSGSIRLKNGNFKHTSFPLSSRH